MADCVVVVVHIENLLLLGVQILISLSLVLVAVREAHGSRNEDVVLTTLHRALSLID